MPKQDVALELYYSGSWHDLAADGEVFADAPITFRRGLGDESGGWPRPATISARLDNAAGKYRTSNPESPLYGLAGRNTPMRLSVGGTVRGIVEASSWSADQTRDFRATPRRGKAWVDVNGGGLLQRIGQWTQPLHSALRRYVDKSGFTPAEYWPMEDVNGSAQAVSAVGGTPMTPVTAVRYTLPDGSPLPPGGAPDFASGAGIPGADKLPSFTGGGTLSAPVRAVSYPDGYTVEWVMQFKAGTDEGGTTSADVLSWRESGTYKHFTVNVTKGFVTVFHANAADDATLTSTGSAVSVIDMYDGAPHYFSYFVHQDGANYSAGMVIDGGAGGGAPADNFGADMVGTVGRPTSIEWNPGEQRGDYMPVAAGHVLIWNGWEDGVDLPYTYDALNGYAGERAAYRFGRLIDEELGTGHYYVSSGFADSMPMGPQRVASLPDLIKDCVTTDDAMLYDHGSELRLFFRCRVDRYNQTPLLELTPSDLTVLPRELTDDKGTANVVTASQRDGGDWTARDDTGPLGTQPPPDGVGEAKRTVNVNLDDPQGLLPQVANWWLRKGTVDLPRFPQLTVDLNANPGLIADVEALDPGSVITLTGFRENVIRLWVLGWTETIGTHTRSITFTCAPDQQYDLGEYYDTIDKRVDSATTTLKTGVNSTATSLTFRTTNFDDRWRDGTNPSGVFSVFIAGEKLNVTTMGSASLVSGAWEQTATVVRSVNGVVKSLSAGEPIHVANPLRWAL